MKRIKNNTAVLIDSEEGLHDLLDCLEDCGARWAGGEAMRDQSVISYILRGMEHYKETLEPSEQMCIRIEIDGGGYRMHCGILYCFSSSIVLDTEMFFDSICYNKTTEQLEDISDLF